MLNTQPTLDLAMILKAKRMLNQPPRVAQALAEFDRINRLIDLQIIAELHWRGRFSLPSNNPFR